MHVSKYATHYVIGEVEHYSIHFAHLSKYDSINQNPSLTSAFRLNKVSLSACPRFGCSYLVAETVCSSCISRRGVPSCHRAASALMRPPFLLLIWTGETE